MEQKIEIANDLPEIIDFELYTKTIIEENWEYIKKEINKLNKDDQIDSINLKFGQNDYEVILYKEEEEEIINKIVISAYKQETCHIIYKESRMITFTHFSGDKSEKNQNLICNPKDIGFYLKKYNIQFPKYKLNEESKSIGSKDDENIFKKEEITEIYDAKNEFVYDDLVFEEYLSRTYKKVSDYYLNYKDDNKCKNINEGRYISNDRRKILENKIKNFRQNNNYFLFLTGLRKIGKSLTILKALKYTQHIYFDIEYIKNLDKKEKYNYIIKQFFTLYNSYEKYVQFISFTFEELIGLDNIIEFIYRFIDYISILINENIIIVIDNYDDFFVKEQIDSEYIEKLHSILLLNRKIKVIICGCGKFFNEMIYNYFKCKILKYDFFYIDNMNIINDKDLNEGSNEYLQYLLKRYNNDLNEVIFYIILFKKIINPINGFEDLTIIKDFPSQFHEFKREKDNKTIIKFYNEEYFSILENEIKNNYLNNLVFCELKYFNNNSFKGFVEEELIINLIEVGKLFNNKIPKENIIIVDELINIKEEKLDKLIDQSQPILIKQKNPHGESFDFILIINKTALYIQIGINKEKNDIKKVLEKNSNNMLKELSQFLNIKLNSCEIIFFFEKEHQEKLKQDYRQLYQKLEQKKISLENIYGSLTNATNTMMNDLDYQIYQEEKDNISYYISRVGAEVCNTLIIPYFLFSIKDFKLYFKENLIKTFEDLLKYIEIMHKIPYYVIEQIKIVDFFNDITEGIFYSKIDKGLLIGFEKGEIDLKFDNFLLSCNELSFNDFQIEYFEKSYKKFNFKNGIISKVDDKNEEEFNNYYLIKLLRKKRKKEDFKDNI